MEKELNNIFKHINKKLKKEVQKSKDYVLELKNKGEKEPLFKFYYCWDKTKHGIDNENCLGIEIVPAGHSPKNLKDLIFLPVL